MKNKLLSHFNFLGRKRKRAMLGIYITPKVVWVCKSNKEKFESAALDISSNDDWKKTFSKIARQFGHAKLQIILSAEWYQVLQVDKPAVSDVEMSRALLWAIKNMVSIPVHKLHLDYFNSPLDTKSKVTVAVVDREQLQRVIHGAVNCHCEIVGISIEEMAVCNLYKSGTRSNFVISHYSNQDILFTIVRNNEPCMQRRVRGFNDINTVSSQKLAYGVADNLSLEIQRSMDYFENQLRQKPVDSIDILIDDISDTLSQLLSANFNQTINVIPKTSVGNLMAYLAIIELFRGINEEPD